MACDLFSVSLRPHNSRCVASTPRVVYMQVARAGVCKKAREQLRCRDAFARFGVYHHVHIISEDAARAELLQLCI